MEKVITNLTEAIASIKTKEQKLLAEHISQINIYNTELSSKIIEETLKKLSELKNWQESIEQIKQEIISTHKLRSAILVENILPTVTKEINNSADEKTVDLIPSTANNKNINTAINEASNETIKINLRTLAQHKFLFCTIFLMTDLNWSRDMFGLECPFAKNYSDELELPEQTLAENSEEKYWQEVFVLGEKKFLITNQWTEASKKKFATWYENITRLDNATKTTNQKTPSLVIPKVAEKNTATLHGDFSKKLTSISLLGKKYTLDFWSEVFTKVCEVMVLRKPYLAAQFDQEKSLNVSQVNFSY